MENLQINVLNESQINQVAGGNFFMESAGTGSAMGAMGGALYNGAAGAAFGAATGMALGGAFAFGYGLATALGAGQVGSAIGGALHRARMMVPR